jgi:lysophospholipase L1-like esterase
VACFGTSIMEHLEAYAPPMVDQAGLPAVGTPVVVERWHKRGYLHRLVVALRAGWPHVRFDLDNHGQGGATSRDVLAIARRAATRTVDLALLGCGINDVWREFEGRAAEAVGLDEFDRNYREVLEVLSAGSRIVVCLAETPFGWAETLDVGAMNAELTRYNAVAARAAGEAGALFLDVWPAFVVAADALGAWSAGAAPDAALWSDGVHLSELGDALMARLVERYLDEHGIVAALVHSGMSTMD